MKYSSRMLLSAVALLVASTRGVEGQRRTLPPMPASPPVQALPPVQAATETTYVLRDGQEVRVSGSYYRSADGKVREDTGNGSVIADVQKGTLTLLNAERKEALVLTIPTPDVATTRQRPPDQQTSYEQAQHEGHTVMKARMIDPDGTQREVWMAPAFALPLFSRIESPGMSATKAFRQIRAEEPDPMVFSVPEGFSVTHQTLPADPGMVPPSPGSPGKGPRR